MKSLEKLSQIILEISFYLLFFLVPLFFYWKNYELFEFNKMVLTYALTIVILFSWILKMVATQKFEVKKTPLDPFILFFLLSQILSTVFSVDVHTSIFGYYSRFHQGLLATISYTVLFYAFVTNMTSRNKVIISLVVTLLSSINVASWGILEHSGKSLSCLIITGKFDVECWVQDVRTRVFATLGQPNWMAAYLAVTILTTIGLFFEKIKEKSAHIIPAILISAFLCLGLLYTRSRSGFLGLAGGLGIFLAVLLLSSFLNKTPSDMKKPINKKSKQKEQEIKAGFLQRIPQSVKHFALILIAFTILAFFNGTGINTLDKFTFPNLAKTSRSIVSPQPEAPYAGPALETGGTESSKIRAIVWKGAFEVFKHYPLFGSGVETFAYAYYLYRPAEHNMVSEWDFLYNKAHNEYLNFAATTGILGIGSYLLFIIGVTALFLVRLKKTQILTLSIFAGWTTILITNFFGFSVVIIGIYFFLLPAFITVLEGEQEKFYTLPQVLTKILIPIALIALLFLSYGLNRLYQADIDFAQGLSLDRTGDYKEAYPLLTKAAALNPLEPMYHDELSYDLANLAVLAAKDKDNDTAQKLTSLAVAESDITTSISPNNINFYKTKTKMYYVLSQLNDSFNLEALKAIQKAAVLAPTDPKVSYNLSLIYGKNNDVKMAISVLEETVKLKPDYRDAWFALAVFYKDSGDTLKAIEKLNYLLKEVAPGDKEAQDKLQSYSSQL